MLVLLLKEEINFSLGLKDVFFWDTPIIRRVTNSWIWKVEKFLFPGMFISLNMYICLLHSLLIHHLYFQTTLHIHVISLFFRLMTSQYQLHPKILIQIPSLFSYLLFFPHYHHLMYLLLLSLEDLKDKTKVSYLFISKTFFGTIVFSVLSLVMFLRPVILLLLSFTTLLSKLEF